MGERRGRKEKAGTCLAEQLGEYRHLVGTSDLWKERPVRLSGSSGPRQGH